MVAPDPDDDGPGGGDDGSSGDDDDDEDDDNNDDAPGPSGKKRVRGLGPGPCARCVNARVECVAGPCGNACTCCHSLKQGCSLVQGGSGASAAEMR